MSREPAASDGPQRCGRAQLRRRFCLDAGALSIMPHCTSAKRAQSNTDSKAGPARATLRRRAVCELIPRAFLNSAVSSSSRQRQLRALNELRPDD